MIQSRKSMFRLFTKHRSKITRFRLDEIHAYVTPAVARAIEIRLNAELSLMRDWTLDKIPKGISGRSTYYFKVKEGVAECFDWNKYASRNTRSES